MIGDYSVSGVIVVAMSREICDDSGLVAVVDQGGEMVASVIYAAAAAAVMTMMF